MVQLAPPPPPCRDETAGLAGLRLLGRQAERRLGQLGLDTAGQIRALVQQQLELFPALGSTE